MEKDILEQTFQDILEAKPRPKFSLRVSTLSQPTSSVIFDALTHFMPEPEREASKDTDVTNMRTVFGYLYEACFASANPHMKRQVVLTDEVISGTADFIDYEAGLVIDTKCVSSGVMTKLKGQPRKGVPAAVNYLGYESQVQAYMYLAGLDKGELHVIDRGYLNKTVFPVVVNPRTKDIFHGKADLARDISLAVQAKNVDICLRYIDLSISINDYHPYSVYRAYGDIFTKGSYGALTGVDLEKLDTFKKNFVTALLTTENIGDYYAV